jgi:hypothetical protein
VAELKTKANDGDVDAFLASIPDPDRRDDARAVCDLLGRVTGEPAVMWGSSIVGFGARHLVYDSGRELDWMVLGFSPRKAATTLYLSWPLDGYADELGRLGKHTTGKGCLYVKRLADIDLAVLEELLRRSYADGIRAAT